MKEAEGLDEVVVPLCDDVAVFVALQREVIGELSIGDDHARGMGAEIAVDALQLHRSIKQLFDRRPLSFVPSSYMVFELLLASSESCRPVPNGMSLE